ncbi:MAG: hypothetical protein ACK5IA_02510 [Cyanobacteriota bacterium]
MGAIGAMGELSDRFAELMARMAKSDADLFRTIGEQNASVRLMVSDLTAGDSQPTPTNTPGALPAAGLLPSEHCDLKALKGRFGKVAEAQIWVEAQIGKAPKKATWAVIEQTCRQGAWPVVSSGKASHPKALTAAEIEERLAGLEERLEQRLQTIESLLRFIAEAVMQNK